MEIKRCPFCQSEAKYLLTQYDGMDFTAVQCTNYLRCAASIECPLACDHKGHPTEYQINWVINAWNTRAEDKK